MSVFDLTPFSKSLRAAADQTRLWIVSLMKINSLSIRILRECLARALFARFDWRDPLVVKETI